MSFLSYAQNFEDVLLWRALGYIKNGFYIDVGANDPVEHSVTKAFYDAGWWGINIEPMPSYHAVFAAQRPRDINLTVAAGADSGHITLFEVPSMNGWASTDRAVAEAHRADGYDVVETDVPLRRLQDICAEHVRGDIHFLKIDVEGFEEAVLRGMDLQRWRPWVLVIEATLPGKQESNHDSWEMLVTQNDYRYAYFDGLNRYYVAAEHDAVFASFGVQANVFDDFISYHLDAAWKATQEMTLSAQRAAADADAAHRDHRQALVALQQEQLRARDELQQAQARADEALWRAQSAHAEQSARQERAYADALRAQAELTQLAVAREAQLHSHIAEIEALRQQQLASTQELERWAHGMQERLQAMLQSSSWRLSAPLRGLGRLRLALGRVRPGSLLRALKRVAGSAARRLLRRLAASDRARRLLIPLKQKVPAAAALFARLTTPPQPNAVAATVHGATLAASPAAAAALGQLDQSEDSAAVRQILADLAAATTTLTR